MNVETEHEMLERVKLMASGDSTWDLSDNDCAAITWLLSRLSAERKAREKAERELAALKRYCAKHHMEAGD